MATLLVGFDSAWSPARSGALVGVLRRSGGALQELGPPRRVDFGQAESSILEWQAEHEPTATIVLLDQPTIVKNAAGQRPVENLVASLVSMRHGGMQPANTGNKAMFGSDAPVWAFLSRFGGPADPLKPAAGTQVIETYPVLTIIALGWTLPDSRPAGRLPKYNPERKRTFSDSDWQHVWEKVSGKFRERGLAGIVGWLDDAGRRKSHRKADQDGLDACLCLLVALDLAERNECLMVGNCQSGYILVPYGAELRHELNDRCIETGRDPTEWVRVVPWPEGAL